MFFLQLLWYSHICRSLTFTHWCRLCCKHSAIGEESTGSVIFLPHSMRRWYMCHWYVANNMRVVHDWLCTMILLSYCYMDTPSVNELSDLDLKGISKSFCYNQAWYPLIFCYSLNYNVLRSPYFFTRPWQRCFFVIKLSLEHDELLQKLLYVFGWGDELSKGIGGLRLWIQVHVFCAMGLLMSCNLCSEKCSAKHLPRSSNYVVKF